MHITIIAALANNRVIGMHNTLPWSLPADLRHFKELTLGKPIIMGRKTFESLGRPLPGRTNIVISRQWGNNRKLGPGQELAAGQALGGGQKLQELGAGREPQELRAETAYIAVDSLPAALAAAENCNCEEAMIIGGANLYSQALPIADRFYLTEVHADIAGDTFFPAWDPNDWREIERVDHKADARNQYDYSFVLLESCRVK